MASNRPTPRLVALQHRDFRLLWAGQFISIIGSQMQLTAIDWHVYSLLKDQTYIINLFGHSLPIGADALGLGGLGLVRIIPIVIFALIGGMIADTQDRRTIMIWTQSFQAVLALVLGVLTLAGRDKVAIIYVISAALAAATAFDNPARQSLVPNLVPREHLTNAVSLNSLVFQIGTVVGPMISGLMLARLNIGTIYVANALTFVAVIVGLLLMNYRKAEVSESTGMSWEDLKAGLHFVYRSRIVWGSMLLDFFATLFSSARTMLPIVAGDILHVGAEGYGLLRTAQPVGAVIAGVILALRKDVHKQGIVLLVSVAIYGAATAIFGIATGMWFAYFMLALTGAGDTVSTVIRGTLRQLVTPDHLRGRMTSVNMVFYMGGPQLGELEAGLVGSVFGVPFAIVTGGLATVFLTAWIALKYPRLRDFTSDMIAEEPVA